MSKAYPCVYFDNGKCKKFSDEKYTSWCTEGACGDEMPSNADSIRAMSDEELAKLFSDLICYIKEGVEYYEAPSRWLEWLKEPVEEV